MFGEVSYNWFTDGGYLTRFVINENQLVYTYSEYYARLQTVNMIAEHLMENVKDNTALTDVQKALLLHDRLANWTSYDYDNQQRGTCPDESYSAVGVLWKRTGVCQGYSEIYAYMLDQCGIPNRFAQSDALNHIWNIVTINGQEYYVDVTWDDPVVDRLGQVRHDNFLVSLNKLRQNHNAYDYITVSNDGRYDNYFWTDSWSEFQLVGDNQLYYLDNVVDEDCHYANLCLWSGNNLSTLQRFNNSQEMKWQTSYGSVYTRNYSILNAWNGKLYINSAKTVYEYTPSINAVKAVYTPSVPYTYDGILGFTIREGRFYFQLASDIPTTDSEKSTTLYYYDLFPITSVKVAGKPSQDETLQYGNYNLRGLSLYIQYADGTSTLLNNVVHGWEINLDTLIATVQLFDYSLSFDLMGDIPLDAPTVKAKNTSAGINVAWNEVWLADKYVVYRSEKVNGSWSDWTNCATTTDTSYADATAKTGKVYRYGVRAYGQGKKSDLSKSDDIRRLTAPTVKATNAKTGTHLSWAAVSGATKYMVYRSYKQNGLWSSWSLVGSSTGKTYTDKTAQAGMVYRYHVRATQDSSQSVNSADVEIRRLTAPKVTVSNANTGTYLSWGKVSGATKYLVYRSYKQSGKWTSWKQVGSTTGKTYTDKTAKGGTVYRYYVKATQGSYQSANSTEVEIRRLNAPKVTVSNAKTGTYLSWVKVSGATKYLVYRSYKQNGKWTSWKQVGSTTGKTYTDKTAKAGTVYRYYVRATQGSYQSVNSANAEIRRLASVTTTAKKSGSTIKLSWTSSKSASYYAVYRRVAGTSTWVKITTTKNRNYTDKSAKKGVYYEYSVRAVNSQYSSAHNPSKKAKR